MIISTRGRYALRVMLDLAQQTTNRYAPLKEIANRQDISEKYLEVILRVLVRSHLFTGLRGKGSGYRLAKEPGEYTLGEILCLTEGGLAPMACVEESFGECSRRETCLSRPVWQKLDTLINDCLGGITLENLIHSPRLDYCQPSRKKQRLTVMETQYSRLI